jgi:hypothetical protein
MKTGLKIKDLIIEFFNDVKTGKIEIYNEFSLQHDFGIYLRKHFGHLKIQFERNIAFFKLGKSKFEKREIDIVIIDSSELHCVIELKYPRNGQVPETMFSFCKDIAFLEQLVISGFRSAYFLAVADHSQFYSNEGKKDGIYKFFRSGEPITGKIHKPTGSKEAKDNTFVTINGRYAIKWIPIADNKNYCLVQVGN